MKLLFVDTSGWVAAADASDPLHAAVCRARDKFLEEGGLLVTTDYIADETLTTLRVRLGLKAASIWWDQASASRRLRWERVETARQDRARVAFFRQKDKAFSFTDCTSFVIMKELGIPTALATDRHFVQAGFRVLPTR